MRPVPVPERNAEENLEASHAGGDNGGSAANSEITSSTGVNLTQQVRSRHPFQSSASFEQPHTISQSTSSVWHMDILSSGGYQHTPVGQASTSVDSLNVSLDEAAHLHHARSAGWSVGNTSSLNANVPPIEVPM
jgi:hypothetical protein